MDLPSEILFDIIDQLDIQDVYHLLLVSRRWRDFITTYDTALFKRRCKVFNDYNVSRPNSYAGPYLDKLLACYALITQRLDGSTFMTRKELDCQPVVILQHPAKHVSSLLTWRMESGGTPPAFALKPAAPIAEEDIFTREDTRENAIMDSLIWACEFNRVPEVLYPTRGHHTRLYPVRRDTKVTTSWGTITVTYGRDLSTSITAVDSTGVILHSCELQDSKWPLKVTYTWNHLFILATEQFITWYAFSHDGTQISKEFTSMHLESLARILVYNGAVPESGFWWENILVETTHSHIILSACSTQATTDTSRISESVHLYTCSYKSMRELGDISCKKLMHLCTNSERTWQGPYFTAALPQCIFFHVNDMRLSRSTGRVLGYMLWCLDLLSGEITRYRYDKSQFVYMGSDHQLFSSTDENMSNLLDEYNSISKQHCLPVGAPIPGESVWTR